MQRKIKENTHIQDFLFFETFNLKENNIEHRDIEFITSRKDVFLMREDKPWKLSRKEVFREPGALKELSTFLLT